MKPFKRKKNQDEQEEIITSFRKTLSDNDNVSKISSGGKTVSMHGSSHSINGGKVDNAQFIVIQAKNIRSGFDYKTGETMLKTDIGGKIATHLEYINRADRNTEDDIFDRIFDLSEDKKLEELVFNDKTDSISNKEFSAFEDKVDDYILKDRDDISITKLVNQKAQVDYLKTLKQGKIEGTVYIKDVDMTKIDSTFMKNIHNNNLKTFVELDKKTNQYNLHIQGRMEDLQTNLTNIENSLSKSDLSINEIKTNIMNEKGKMTYKEFNDYKSVSKEKGIDASTRLEISPKEQLNRDQLELLATKLLSETKRLTGKDFDGFFSIHTNTDHNHIHMDFNGSKNQVILSAEQLQFIKVVAAEITLDIVKSADAEKHLEKEMERLEIAKKVQILKDEFNLVKKELAVEREMNISNLSYNLNKNIGITQKEIDLVELKTKYENILSSQKTKLLTERNPEKIKELEKKIGFTEKSLDATNKKITPEMIEKREEFKELFERAKQSLYMNDIKEEHKINSLNNIDTLAFKLTEMKQDRLAEAMKKSAYAEKFNQYFSDYKADKAIKNIFTKDFNTNSENSKSEKLDNSKKAELEKIEKPIRKSSDEFKKVSIKEEVSNQTKIRNSINKEEDPVSYKIEAAKFIDLQIISRGGYDENTLDQWGKWKISKETEGMNDKDKEIKIKEIKEIVETFKENTLKRALELTEAGLLTKNVDKNGVETIAFSDEKAKEILFNNLGLKANKLLDENIKGYKEHDKVEMEKQKELLKIEKEAMKNNLSKDINLIILDNKDDINVKYHKNLELADKANNSSDINVLKELSTNKNEKIRELVAGNSNTTGEILETLSKDKNDNIKLNVIAHQNVSERSINNILSDKSEEFRVEVSLNNKVKPEILDRMTRDESSFVKLGLTKNDNTSAVTLDRLSNIPNEKIKTGVIYNPNVSLKTLEKLSKDDSEDVRRAVAKIDKIDRGIIDHLKSDMSELVKESLAKNTNLSRKDLKEILEKSYSREVKSAIILNPNVASETLEKLSKDDNEKVRIVLSSKENLEDKLFINLSKDDNLDVRKTLAENKTLKENVISEIVKTEKNPDVKVILVKHENIKLDDLKELSEDKSSKVREAVLNNPKYKEFVKDEEAKVKASIKVEETKAVKEEIVGQMMFGPDEDLPTKKVEVENPKQELVIQTFNGPDEDLPSKKSEDKVKIEDIKEVKTDIKTNEDLIKEVKTNIKKEEIKQKI